MAFIQSCSKDRIELWDGYEYVYDRNGRVDSYSFDHRKPFVANTYSQSALKFALRESPQGKINRMIKENSWCNFVFYCDCQLCDTTALVKTLKKYECEFPVIIDPNRTMWKLNKISVSGISYVCRKDGQMIGYGVIGASGSPFDAVFQKLKN